MFPHDVLHAFEKIHNLLQQHVTYFPCKFLLDVLQNVDNFNVFDFLTFFFNVLEVNPSVTPEILKEQLKTSIKTPKI